MAYNTPFVGDIATNFVTYLRQMDGEVQVNMRQLYARAIAVVQSPGTGKSHMLTEVGLGFFAVTLCLKVPARLVKNYLLFQSAFMSQMLWAIQLQTGRFSTILRLCLRPTTVLQRCEVCLRYFTKSLRATVFMQTVYSTVVRGYS